MYHYCYLAAWLQTAGKQHWPTSVKDIKAQVTLWNLECTNSISLNSSTLKSIRLCASIIWKWISARPILCPIIPELWPMLSPKIARNDVCTCICLCLCLLSCKVYTIIFIIISINCEKKSLKYSSDRIQMYYWNNNFILTIYLHNKWNNFA